MSENVPPTEAEPEEAEQPVSPAQPDEGETMPEDDPNDENVDEDEQS